MKLSVRLLHPISNRWTRFVTRFFSAVTLHLLYFLSPAFSCTYYVLHTYLLSVRTYRYRLLKQLGKGSFCVAYLAIHVQRRPSRNTCCIKTEKTDNEKVNFRQLHFESKLYELLYHEEGFPHANRFGKEKAYNFLAMDLLGPNLDELHVSNNGVFSMKTMCLLACQMITRLQSLHKHNYIHRDIKPENFMIGRNKRASTVYLCDLGLCKRFRRGDTKVHIPFQTNRSLAGTARWVRRSGNRGGGASLVLIYA